MVYLRLGRSQHRASAASQPKCKTNEAKAPQNGRRKSGSNEGRGVEIIRCKFHQRGKIPKVAGKHRHGEKKMESSECVQTLQT
jgi:hypothetical protein